MSRPESTSLNMQEPPRLPGETPRAYATFLQFLHLGPRRQQTQVARQVKRTIWTINKLASKHHWLERCAEYDAEIRRQENELAEINRKADWEARARWEQRRRQLSIQIVENAARVVNDILRPEIEYTKVGKDGKRRAEGTFALMHCGILLREFNRLALAASHDLIREEALKENAARAGQEALAAVERIAGSFEVGDTMFDGSEPPPLPEKKEASQPAGEPLVDLEGTEGLYPGERHE